MPDHVLDSFVASFRVQRVLDRFGGFDEVVDVDAGAIRADAPNHAGHVVEQRLHQQHHRHPLVVADSSSRRALLPGQRVGFEVVGVREPAVLVRVLLVIAGEVGRAPAVYRGTHVLRTADQDDARDQYDNGVPVVQSIGEVVVRTRVDFGDPRYGVQQSVCGRPGSTRWSSAVVCATYICLI